MEPQDDNGVLELEGRGKVHLQGSGVSRFEWLKEFSQVGIIPCCGGCDIHVYSHYLFIGEDARPAGSE
jgi:hypothetical protein